jgi:hypothetical protein
MWRSVLCNVILRVHRTTWYGVGIYDYLKVLAIPYEVGDQALISDVCDEPVTLRLPPAHKTRHHESTNLDVEHTQHKICPLPPAALQTYYAVLTHLF